MAIIYRHQQLLMVAIHQFQSFPYQTLSHSFCTYSNLYFSENET